MSMGSFAEHQSSSILVCMEGGARRSQGPTPSGSDAIGLSGASARLCIFRKFLGDMDTEGWRPDVENHYPNWLSS